MSIQKHLEKYYNVEDFQEVEEIALDNFKMSELKENDKKMLEKYSEVRKFSMNFCGLKFLNYLPNFKTLDTVVL